MDTVAYYTSLAAAVASYSGAVDMDTEVNIVHNAVVDMLGIAVVVGILGEASLDCKVVGASVESVAADS